MDGYDRQIKRLMESPSLIPTEWAKGKGIFDWLSKDRTTVDGTGCPSLVKKAFNEGEKVNLPKELVEIIKNLPVPRCSALGIENLEVFAQAQRAADRIFNRVPYDESATIEVCGFIFNSKSKILENKAPNVPIEIPKTEIY